MSVCPLCSRSGRGRTAKLALGFLVLPGPLRVGAQRVAECLPFSPQIAAWFGQMQVTCVLVRASQR